MPALPSLARVDIHQTHKCAPAELSILLRRIICSLIRPEKQMPALPSLARVDIHQTRKTAPAELIFLLRRNFAC